MSKLRIISWHAALGVALAALGLAACLQERSYLNDDAYLKNLNVSGGTLSPDFAPDIRSYAVMVPNATPAVVVTATANDLNAQSIAIAQDNGPPMQVGSGFQSNPLAVPVQGTVSVIRVVVTAQDGDATRTYRILLSQAPLPPVTGLTTPRNVPVARSMTLTLPAGEMLPANNASDVPVDTLLRIAFDGPPVLGTSGTINIYRASDDALVDTINLSDSFAIYDGTSSIRKLTTNLTSSKLNIIGGVQTGIDQVRVVNYIPMIIGSNTATIYPHNTRLAYGTQYYVTIDSGVLTGVIHGMPFEGVGANAWTFTTKAAVPADYVVAADNSADFATVQGAIDAVPAGNRAPVTIRISPGVYQEMLFIRNKNNLTLQGTDSVATVIQYENCDGFNPGTGATQAVSSPGPNGRLPDGNLDAGGRALLLVNGADLLRLDSITLKNTHAQNATTLQDGTSLSGALTYVNYNSAITQAETIYFNTSFTSSSPAGRLIAKHSNFVSYQDTIQVKGWSWFYDCFVTGDVDFIWGNANAALFERCEIKSRFRTGSPASVVQSRAYLGYGSTMTPSSYDQSYPGFVFLNCALTKEDGAFTAYLARSPGAATVSSSGTPPVYYYLQYDIVAFINSTMDSHIAPQGWSTPGPNLAGTAVAGWREYGNFTPARLPVNVSNRLSMMSNPASSTGNSSIQLKSEDAAIFFADRALVFGGATNGRLSTTGYPGGWEPQP
jgi:pectin methylesterase-like acyl-CoA thioesterase